MYYTSPSHLYRQLTERNRTRNWGKKYYTQVTQ